MSEINLFNRWTVKKKHFWLAIGLGIPALCVLTFVVWEEHPITRPCPITDFLPQWKPPWWKRWLLREIFTPMITKAGHLSQARFHPTK